MKNPLRIFLAIVFILVPVVNFGLPPLLGEGNQFADDPSTRVDAAGYAFAIWGVIFTGMLVFSFYLLTNAEPDSKPLTRATVLLSIAGIASIAFVPVSIYCSALIGWFDILAHLIPLAIAHWQLRKHALLYPKSNAGRWTFFGPSMYFGWISAATVISTALMANETGIVVADSLATVIAIVTAVMLAAFAILMTIKRHPVYGATIAWALIAIGVEQAAFPLIRYVAWVAAAVIVCCVLWRVLHGNPFYPISSSERSEPLPTT